MKKIKVAHLFNEINFSGAEIMYAQAAPLFQKQGFELIAVSTGAGKGNYVQQYEQANYTIYHKPISALSIRTIPQFILYYVNFYRFLKKEQIEIMHIHRSSLVFIAVIAWLAKVRCIKTQHNTFKNRWFTLPYAIFWRFMLRNLFNVTFQTIGESVYRNELNYYKNPSTRINNWFDKQKFYPAESDEEKSQLRNQFDIPQDAFVIISVGGCSQVKNHHDIIKALSLVKDDINIVYLHLGQGGTEREEKQLAADLGVSDNIQFLGNKDNVRDYLVAADLFVMTSKFEGLGNVALEAMACQLPCILYDVTGLRDLIKEDDNGFLIHSDYKLLAKNIIHIQKDKSISQEKAKQALNSVNRDYSISVSVEKMIDLYKN